MLMIDWDLLMNVYVLELSYIIHFFITGNNFPVTIKNPCLAMKCLYWNGWQCYFQRIYVVHTFEALLYFFHLIQSSRNYYSTPSFSASSSCVYDGFSFNNPCKLFRGVPKRDWSLISLVWNSISWTEVPTQRLSHKYKTDNIFMTLVEKSR